MEWFSTWTAWHWLIIGFLLLIAETAMPGVFLLWWGLAAIVIAGISALIPSLPLTVMSIAYAILALFFSLMWWKYQRNKDKEDEPNSTLNQKGHAMLGLKGIVQEINSNGIGRGYFGDTTWRIQGEHLKKGDNIQVVSVQGITLFVQKLD